MRGKSSPQHQQDQQDVDEAKSCSQYSRSSVHVELQIYELHCETMLADERQARLKC